MQKIKRTFKFLFTHPLGRKHPFKSLMNFIIWQLQCQLRPSAYIIKNFVSPVKFYARKGLTGITGNIYTGLHEFEDMAFLLHFLRSEDAFFDVGANVGSYTLLASGVCRCNSIAIEPVKSTFDILSKNVQLNKLNNVQLINAAAGANEGTIKFTADQDTTNHAVAADEITKTNSIEVPVLTIDSLLNDNHAPALVKIDVEGFETEVLKGMKTLLLTTTFKAIIIELNGSGERYGFDELAIHNLILSHQFNPYNYNPFKRSLSMASSYSNLNTIYCRDIEFIESRIKSAKPVKIRGQYI